MFKKNIRQKFATRTLNKKNKVLFTRNPKALADQLMVLKAVNDGITGREDDATGTVVRASFGSELRRR